MYVAELDRPWVETPFMFQGFIVRDPREIQRIQGYCAFVFVDNERGIVPSNPGSASGTASMSLAPLPKPSIVYEVESEVESELETAKNVHIAVTQSFGQLLTEVRSGQAPQLAQVREVISEMEESILRNPDAFMWLRRLKKKDSYTFSHCIDTSILLMAFGRQMGLPRQHIHELGLGGLMADIGKMKVPDALLRRDGPLNPAEFEVVKRHVNYSVEIMGASRDMAPNAIAIVAAHHERFDGTGYPDKLSAGQIPMHARMAAIVDTFDAVTSDRAHAKALAPHDAIALLYEQRNKGFQDELIEQFIQTLGPYPVGTLIEFDTGEVGIVIEQNRVRRLRPKVVLLLDASKRPIKSTPTLNLMSETHNEDGQAINILHSLTPGAYDIDPEEFYL
jgi:HD-GYP domain-containing protein (c-di-GMP phosphodiesterase class II)